MYLSTAHLESIFELDQKSISEFKSGQITSNKLAELQTRNTEVIKGIIMKDGFPFPEISSEKAYKAAFLAVLHGSDLELMNQVLNVFENKQDMAIKKDMTFLIDKILVLQGKSQLYGTQYKYNLDKSAQIKFFDIETPELLDQRRRAAGLESHMEYRKQINNQNS